MQTEPPANPADKWQKHYYRGPPAQAMRLFATCPVAGAGASADAERRIARLEATLAKRALEPARKVFTRSLSAGLH